MRASAPGAAPWRFLKVMAPWGRRGWLWLALAMFAVLSLGGPARMLISARVAAVDSALDSLVADRLLSDALIAAQGLRLALAQPGDAGAERHIQALAAMAGPAQASVVPSYAIAGPEVAALRALIPPALSEVQRLRSLADPTGMPLQRVASLEREIEVLRGRSAQLLAQRDASLEDTAHIIRLIRYLLLVIFTALVVFIGLMLRSQARMRLAHRQIAQWAEETARLLDAIPGLLVRARKDPDGEWVRSFVGEAVVELTGHTVVEALTHGWLRDNIPPDDLELLLQMFDEALAGAQRSPTVRFRRKDGRVIRIRMLLSRHIQGNGLVELICLWSDATREHELTERLAHTARLAHMGELMNGMAHELNQPLTSISLAAENAMRIVDRSPVDAARLQSKLGTMVAMAARASLLVERLREFVREDETPKAPLHLDAVVGAALDMLENRLRLAGVTVAVDVPAELPPILGRALPLEQVLTQLITNTLDIYATRAADREAGPGAGDQGVVAEKPSLSITAQAVGGAVQLVIQDQAGGIAPEHLGRIFDPFFTTKPVGEGTGLGLSSSFGILQEMGGSITAENQEGGARFTLRLPLA